MKSFFAKFSLRGGKLHGLFQLFGIHSRDPYGRCAEDIYNGLSFIAWYENGIPIGPSWRQLIGGSWLYGIADTYGHFSGVNSEEVAYIYQDLELAMIGKFQNGLMVILSIYP